MANNNSHPKFLDINGAQRMTGKLLDKIADNKGVFIDLWNDAAGEWGCYNAETGFFELNGLTDITYKQALDIYNAGYLSFPNPKLFPNVRTNLLNYGNTKGVIIGYVKTDLIRTFGDDNAIEVINLSVHNSAGQSMPIRVNKFDNTFTYCFELKKIIGVIDCYYLDANTTLNNLFSNCSSLQDVEITNLNRNIRFSDCKWLSRHTLDYIVSHRYNSGSSHNHTYSEIHF